MSGKIIKYRLPCTAQGPEGSCGSSDAMVMYEDGGKFCHKCEGHDNREKGNGFTQESTLSEFSNVGSTDFSFYYDAHYAAIKERRIQEETCKKYGVRTDDQGRHLFPAYNKEGQLTAVKIVTPAKGDNPKLFKIVGSIGNDALLFGMNEFPKTGRSATVTEGEYDAMAAYQMSGSKYPNFSIWNGVGGGDKPKKEFARNFDELKEFDELVLNFDNDKPGKDGVENIGPMFPGRVKVLELTEGKDACDYLKANKISKYVDEYFRAKFYTLGGVINGADTWDKYKAEQNIESIPFDKQYTELNHKTYGIRMGEIVLVTAGTGSGKTQVLREWKYHLLRNTKETVFDIALEENLGSSVGGLMALHANRRITLPDVQISEEEERKIHSELFDSGRYYTLDHEGSVEDDNLLDKMEYAATVLGAKILFLDHITIAVSDCAAGSENLSMDKFMNRLLKMVKRLNICVIVVSHLRKTGGGGKSFEEGRIPTEDDLKGSGSLKQIAMTTIAIARNKYAECERERNTTSFHVLKCRFSGRTGPCDHAFFDDDTGRMNVIDVNEEDYDEVLGDI